MKQFNERNDLKKKIHERQRTYWIKQREIRYVNLGHNIGFEEDGKGNDFKRPVLVLKKIGNIFAVLPMTTK
jgi:mRNA interferase MazF